MFSISNKYIFQDIFHACLGMWHIAQASTKCFDVVTWLRFALRYVYPQRFVGPILLAVINFHRFCQQLMHDCLELEEKCVP